MKVEILKPKGYCAGVNAAINLAKKVREDNPNQDIFVLGMLVHNNFVVNELEELGIHSVKDINEVPDGAILIFSAHGHKIEYDEIAKAKNLIIYDSVCPKVLHNINLIKENLEQGHQIIYIGQEKHPEADACLSLSKKVILYTKNILENHQCIFDESPLVINQTTLNILDIKAIHDSILECIPNARIANEICGTTRLRQEAIKNLGGDVDLIIVVGDINSSNTRRLFEIAQQCHPEKESVMISSVDRLDKSILENKNHIVISSGASTPEHIIDEVYELINNY